MPAVRPGRIAATTVQIVREFRAVQRLVRSGRIRAFGDVVAYRLIGLGVLRPNGRVRTVRMVDGSLLSYRRNRGDIQTFREVWLEGCYRLPEGVDPVTVLDLGANIGLTSVWLAARYGVERVIAVEPDPGNAALARRNFTANGLNGRVVEAAIAPEPGVVFLRRRGQTNTGRTYPAGGVPVAAVTPEQLLEEVGGRVDLVKMDIEGAEGPLLLGGDGSWLGGVGWLIAELHPGLIDHSEVVGAIERAGLVRLAPHSLWEGSMEMFRPLPASG